MRIRWILVICIAHLFIACSKESGAPRYDTDTKQYGFFKLLSDSLKIPILDPDHSIDLIRTKKFTVRTADIMPILYQAFYQYETKLHQFPKTNLPGYIRRMATMEAERRLMLHEANEGNISVSEDTLQSHLQRIYDNYGSQETFERIILREGFSPDMVREDMMNNLIVQNYINDVYYTQTTVDEGEIRAIYEQDKLATVRHILLLTQDKSEAEKKKLYKKMQGILDRARSGEDFAELAKQYTEDPGSRENDGLYEDFSRGHMVKPFEDASFETPVGSISDIVETTYGYHIIKVIRRTKETNPFEEMKKTIHVQLARNRNPDLVRSVLDSLKEKYKYQDVVPDSL